MAAMIKLRKRIKKPLLSRERVRILNMNRRTRAGHEVTDDCGGDGKDKDKHKDDDDNDGERIAHPSAATSAEQSCVCSGQASCAS